MSDNDTARTTWKRYELVRDRGHIETVRAMNRNEAFGIKNEQWSQEALDNLGDRPAITLNIIFQILEMIAGQQIQSRANISYKPKPGGTSEIADLVTILAMQTCDDRQFHHYESQMFLDGLVMRRGFIDLRLDYSDNLNGEPSFSSYDPRQVIPDPDATEYDPDKWNDVITTRYHSYNGIVKEWGEKKAKEVKESAPGQTSGINADYGSQGADPTEGFRFNAFGGDARWLSRGVYDTVSLTDKGDALYRVVERQHYVYGEYPHYVYPSGDIRPVPHWIPEELMRQKAELDGLEIRDIRSKRIRHTVSTRDVLLYDSWSMYRHFTVIPFFPYFQRGITMSMVDYLISPQEMLNKVASQIVHVVNTTANSGWMVPEGSLVNMTMDELDERGADTGLNLEFNPEKGEPKKIQPNQIPSGLVEFRDFAVEMMKTVSGASDQARGFRESNESGIAIERLQKRFAVSLQRPLSNQDLTRQLVGRNLLHLFQDHYSDERVVMITKQESFGKPQHEPVTLNETVEAGVADDGNIVTEILNDLTAGEYLVKVSSTPAADTFGEGQFNQLVSMRSDLGIQVPDEAIVEASNIPRKSELLDMLQQQNNAADPAEEDLALQREAEKVKIEKEREAIKAQSVETSATALEVAEKIVAQPGLAAVAEEIERGAEEEQNQKTEMEMSNGTE